MNTITNYIASEAEINDTVNDFTSFCHFIEEKKPTLSKGNEVLGKNNLFELNKLLKFKKEVSLPHFPHKSYPFIDLMFHLAQEGKLYVKSANQKGNVYMERSSRKAEFDNLNIFEKYSFLLETFWTQNDFWEAIDLKLYSVDPIIQYLAKSRPGVKLRKGAFSKMKDHDPVFSYEFAFIHYISFFGFCTFVPLVHNDKKFSQWNDNIKEIIPTEFGVNMCQILSDDKMPRWHLLWLDVLDLLDNPAKKFSKKIPFLKYLEPIFPKGVIKHTIKKETIKVIKGNYTFRISLGTDFWITIKLSSKDSLDDLHLAIQEAIDFDNDHLYSFFMDGKKFSRHAYHSPMGDDDPFTDEAIIGKLGLYVGQKILYFFDYGDTWEFQVKLMAIDEGEPFLKNPEIIESKGEAPVQYEFYDEEEDEDGFN